MAIKVPLGTRFGLKGSVLRFGGLGGFGFGFGGLGFGFGFSSLCFGFGLGWFGDWSWGVLGLWFWGVWGLVLGAAFGIGKIGYHTGGFLRVGCWPFQSISESFRETSGILPRWDLEQGKEHLGKNVEPSRVLLRLREGGFTPSTQTPWALGFKGFWRHLGRLRAPSRLCSPVEGGTHPAIPQAPWALGFKGF